MLSEEAFQAMDSSVMKSASIYLIYNVQSFEGVELLSFGWNVSRVSMIAYSKL